ncbi:MAG: TolC family protein [Bryobacteraceae bacterium]|nr:TolC family protein [Bryobacteraceae bacterium]
MISLLFLATGLAAEIHTLTLKQSVEIAGKQNPDLLAARFDERKAQQAIREARDPFFPKLIVGSGLAYTNGFPLSIEGSAPSLVRADAIQTLFNRQRSYDVAKVREQARGSALSAEAKRDDAALKAALAHLETERLRRGAEIAARQAESLEKAAEITRIRVREGEELELENKKMAARLAQVKHRARVLEAAATIEEEALALILGFPAGDLARPAMEERTPAKPPATEEELAAAALENSKELKTLQSKMLAAGLDIKANQAARLPKIELVAQYGLFARFNNYDDFFRKFQRHNGQLGVSFQLPILPGSAASARERQAEDESARLRLETNTARQRIALDARRKHRDLRNAESARDVAQLDLEAAREELAVVLARFGEGRALSRQVDETRFLENEKWLAFLDAQYAVEKRRVEVWQASGDLLAALR